MSDLIRSSTQDITNGKIKAWLKVHTLINATDVAAQITITDANASDMAFLQAIKKTPVESLTFNF